MYYVTPVYWYSLLLCILNSLLNPISSQITLLIYSPAVFSVKTAVTPIRLAAISCFRLPASTHAIVGKFNFTVISLRRNSPPRMSGSSHWLITTSTSSLFRYLIASAPVAVAIIRKGSLPNFLLFCLIPAAKIIPLNGTNHLVVIFLFILYFSPQYD